MIWAARDGLEMPSSRAAANLGNKAFDSPGQAAYKPASQHGTAVSAIRAVMVWRTMFGARAGTFLGCVL